MVLAVSVAVVAVALGVLLAFVPSVARGALGPLRTFATAAAIAVVVGHLAPEALEGLGVVAIFVFLVGLFLPTGVHWIRAVTFGGRRESGEAAERVKLEVSYLGLLVHHVGDGVGLGTYSVPSQSGQLHADVLVALAAHTVPLVAVVAFAYREAAGVRAAFVRSLGLALASIVGVLLSASVSAELLHGASAWIAALVAGLLLHVVTHDLTADAPRSALSRSADLVFALAGLFVGVLGAAEHGHSHAAGSAHYDFGDAFVTQAEAIAVAGVMALLLGFVARRAFWSFGVFGAERSRGALSGALFGALSSSCASDAPSLRRVSGGSMVFGVSFWLGARSLGVMTLLLSLFVWTPVFAGVRYVAAGVLAIFAALLISRNQDREAHTLPPSGLVPKAERDASDDFHELAWRFSVWLLLGITIAALLDSGVHEGALTPYNSHVLELIVPMLVVVVFRVSTIALIPVTSVLLAKGASPGAVMALVLVLGCLDWGRISGFARHFGVRTAALLSAIVMVTGVFVGYLVNLWPGLATGLMTARADEATSQVVSRLALGLLGAVCLYMIWRKGFRGWFSGVADVHAGDSH